MLFVLCAVCVYVWKINFSEREQKLFEDVW